MAKRTDLPPDPASVLAAAIQLADEVRSALLLDAAEEEAVKEEALNWERARLASKYGGDSARTREAAARVESRAELRAQLYSEFQRSLVKPAPVTAETAVLQGRAVDGSGAGVSGLKVVVLAKDRKTTLGTSETDEIGHYSVTLKSKEEVEVFVEVRLKSKTIYRDKKKLRATPGTVLYHEISVEPVPKRRTAGR